MKNYKQMSKSELQKEMEMNGEFHYCGMSKNEMIQYLTDMAIARSMSYSELVAHNTAGKV